MLTVVVIAGQIHYLHSVSPELKILSTANPHSPKEQFYGLQISFLKLTVKLLLGSKTNVTFTSPSWLMLLR